MEVLLVVQFLLYVSHELISLLSELLDIDQEWSEALLVKCVDFLAKLWGLSLSFEKLDQDRFVAIVKDSICDYVHNVRALRDVDILTE